MTIKKYLSCHQPGIIPYNTTNDRGNLDTARMDDGWDAFGVSCRGVPWTRYFFGMHSDEVIHEALPSRELTYPKNGILKMIFLFPRWDMLIPWRVGEKYHVEQRFCWLTILKDCHWIFYIIISSSNMTSTEIPLILVCVLWFNDSTNL